MKPPLLCLHGPDGLEITLSPRGASWLSCRVPVEGETGPREVLAGSSDPEDPQRLACYAGATIGRWANRIAGAVLRRDGHVWPLVPHPAGSAHQLHGGPDGWSHRLWRVEEQAPDQAVFALHSPDGDQGFPGAVEVRVRYRLHPGRRLRIDFEACADAPTPLAMTNHAYFNLDGVGTPGDARAQRLRLHADAWMPVDAALIPTGPPVALDGEIRADDPMDLRRLRAADARPFATHPAMAAAGGYDHGWRLAPGHAQEAARLVSADGRLAMSIATSMPALQFYDGRALAPPCAGLALEPGWLPDSLGRDDTGQPDAWLRPGVPRHDWIEYRFG